MKEFSDWITDKYREWRGDAVGRERTITDFANYIGVNQSVVSSWMKKGGKVPKHKDSIDKLVAKFGPEVYNVLGIDAALTDDVIDPVAAMIQQFPPEDRPLVRQAVLDALAELQANPDIIHNQDQVTTILAKAIQKRTNREGANPPEVVKKKN